MHPDAMPMDQAFRWLEKEGVPRDDTATLLKRAAAEGKASRRYPWGVAAVTCRKEGFCPVVLKLGVHD